MDYGQLQASLTPKVKIFNPTLEKVRMQCDSKAFSFESNEYTGVPIDLLQHILPAVEPKGLFLVIDNGEEDGAKIDAQKLDGLRKFLTQTLEERIRLARLA